jgi:hypothetical protein
MLQFSSLISSLNPYEISIGIGNYVFNERFLHRDVFRDNQQLIKSSIEVIVCRQLKLDVLDGYFSG